MGKKLKYLGKCDAQTIVDFIVILFFRWTESLKNNLKTKMHSVWAFQHSFIKLQEKDEKKWKILFSLSHYVKMLSFSLCLSTFVLVTVKAMSKIWRGDAVRNNLSRD